MPWSQRLELMQMMAKKTGSRGLGKLFAEATRDFPMHDRHDMLSEILPQMTPLPRDLLLDILGSATMGSTEIQFMLMQRLHESVAPSLRGEMMVELFTVRRWLSISAALCGSRQSLLPLLLLTQRFVERHTHVATDNRGWT
jgi:hypothetical protein